LKNIWKLVVKFVLLHPLSRMKRKWNISRGDKRSVLWKRFT